MKPLKLAASILFVGLALGSSLAAQPAVYAPVGTGCPGSDGIPLLSNLSGDLPGIGTSFGAELSRVADSGFAVGILGLSNSAISGMPLPLDLGLVGMPGCSLYTDIRRQVGLAISGGRSEWWTLLPSDSSWLGQSFYQQVIVIDPSVPGLGAVMSNAAMGVIGVLPDLFIATGTPTVTPDPLGLGGIAQVSSFVVKNQGLFPAIGVFHTGIYLSTDSTITESDTLLDSIAINGLVPGQSHVVAGRTVTLPAALPLGDYWLGILADRTNVISEMDETNNFVASRTTVLPLPDLFIATGTPTVTPDLVWPGGTAQVSAFVVRNQGLLPAIGVFHTGIYLSTDSTITESDTLLDSIATNTLVPGQSHVVAGRTVTIPAGQSPGDYWLGILTDRANVISEMDETNNFVASRITVELLPDLVITSGAPNVNTPITLDPLSTWGIHIPPPTIKNQGAGVAGAFTVSCYLSRDSKITRDDTHLRSASVSGLLAGDSFELPHASFTRVFIPIPPTPTGTYWIGFVVDPFDSIPESNNGNNDSPGKMVSIINPN